MRSDLKILPFVGAGSLQAAVSWLLEDGPFEYWRSKVTAFQRK
jgi:hypothetical protein